MLSITRARIKLGDGPKIALKDFDLRHPSVDVDIVDFCRCYADMPAPKALETACSLQLLRQMPLLFSCWSEAVSVLQAYWSIESAKHIVLRR